MLDNGRRAHMIGQYFGTDESNRSENIKISSVRDELTCKATL